LLKSLLQRFKAMLKGEQALRGSDRDKPRAEQFVP
jgi:hypothetical protein